MSSIKNVKAKCDDEAKYLKSIILNNDYSKFIFIIKKQLTKILFLMRANAKIDLKTALSDGIFTGNIGTSDPEQKIDYLLSDKATIREKVAAISNTIYDAVKEEPIVENAKKLYKYIMDNKDINYSINEIYNKIQMVTKNKYPEKLDYNSNNNIALLWCPLLYAFPGYAFKRANINLHSLVGKVKEKKLKKEYLIEELSENEKNFLKANHIDLSGDTYEIETGMNLYGDLVNNLKYYNYEDDMCHVAGISGHSILHFTLGQIFNIDYRAILFGQLLEMTPMHHSMTEVYWAANDMGFLPLFENYADMRNRINEIIINYSTEINLLTIYDSPFQPISVKSIRGGLKRNIRK